MKQNFLLPGILVASIFVLLSAFFIRESAKHSSMYAHQKNKIAQILNFNDRLLSIREWIFTQESWEEKKAAMEKIRSDSEKHYQKARQYGYNILFSSILFLLSIGLIYGKARPFFAMTFGTTIVALVLLVEGISNPMLEIAVFKNDLTVKVYLKPKDLPYFDDAIGYLNKMEKFTGFMRLVPVVGQDLAESTVDFVQESRDFLDTHKDQQFGIEKVFQGRTYFYYQNKGILDLFSLLWKGGNRWVALAIVLFSVLIPIFKLTFTLLFVLIPGLRMNRLEKMLAGIAKWSMADVFVVSIFLAYLSFANMSPGVDVDAHAIFGLYYFLGYVVLSIGLSFLLRRSIFEEKSKT